MENKTPVPFDRSGTRWTKQEEDEMLKELTSGKTFEDIAILHSRCVGGIEARLKLIAAKKLDVEREQTSGTTKKTTKKRKKTDEKSIPSKKSKRLGRLIRLEHRISILETNEKNNERRIATLENKLKIAEYEIALSKAYGYIAAASQIPLNFPK